MVQSKHKILDGFRGLFFVKSQEGLSTLKIKYILEGIILLALVIGKFGIGLLDDLSKISSQGGVPFLLLTPRSNTLLFIQSKFVFRTCCKC